MPINKPIIGVIACTRSIEGEPAQTVKLRYLEGVAHLADAIPLIIPSNQPQENATSIVERLDAVLLTGSNSNIDPTHYGSPVPGQVPIDKERDSYSIALIKAAMAAGKPVFGICRGLQEINVAMGGTLTDLRVTGTNAPRHHAPDGVSIGEMFGHSHEIAVRPDTPLFAATGAEALKVNSVHFQTIDRLGDNLEVNATGPDGVIEAISGTDTRAPVFAVQWHPEWQPANRPHDVAFWRYVGETARNHAPARA
ncbi:gamma-glutamyl-gamma-aminobutyrate hydrolase family protein [Devosia rhodophyticola]|uniref:Gamma-glutamyl-gamma-aminobutyrate hydrolase family protein n=1 Tax=Devosia rhodophyticola TaxID=3026423 RepID=A0ABY7Z0Q1_9HYPH|nr:gamma-glutamyl-gamma-aminobutyrate hydrolase family protein [Devosia rhodophyticola]WDR06898.1 gamma-glutamyl-gamma-aminobutyrate hydrolase family protein [Devosia rhodophyticola]